MIDSLDINSLYAYQVPGIEMKTKIEYEWRPWIPEGWTDDLGIIADRNQWVREQLPGWYVFIPYSIAHEVYDWCNQNIKGEWSYGAGVNHRKLYIRSDKDFTWFTMKWL